MQNDPNNPHDFFFVTMFSDVEIIRQFITRHFPPELVELFDLSEIQASSESYTDESKRMFTDVIIQIPLKQGESAEIYILLEHKSYPDPYARLQMLRYLVGKWRAWQINPDKTTKYPPIIIPVLVSHGPRKWRYSTNFEDLFDCPTEALWKFIPKFTHLLFDLRVIPPEKLREEILLNTVLLVMKYIFFKELRDELGNIYAPLAHIPDQNRRTELAQAVTSYIVSTNSDVAIDDIEEALREMPQGENIMPTIAENWVQEGVRKGMLLGEEKGLQQGMQLGEEKGMEALRSTLSNLLIARFQTMPPSLAQKLRLIDNSDTLSSLTINILSISSIEDFEALVDKTLAHRIQ